MNRAPYAGQARKTAPTVRSLSPRPENQSVRYLRQLRAWVAGTPDLTPRDLLDKIDDLMFQARGGK